MKAVSIFTAKGYRAFICSWLEAQEQSHGLLSQMCHAMSCQNSHLTRVLKEKVHLTMDHAFRLSTFFHFGKAEASYFLKLVEHDRSGDALFKRQLLDEMNQIKKEQENLAKRFQQDQIGNLEKEMIYYSSWHWTAIHYITEIVRYQRPAEIAHRLGLNEGFVRKSLEVLEKFALVQKRGEVWQLNSGSIHLPKNSPLNSVQHSNWRNRAVLRSQDIEDDGLHFTAVQTLSHDDFEKIKHLLLKAIDDYRKIAKPSTPEELICFSCDFFRA